MDPDNQSSVAKTKSDKPKGRGPKSKHNKKARIIVRNLSFKATEEAVKNWFVRHGEVEDVKLLKKPDGTLVGCAFVQYKTVPGAAKGIKECNAKPFLGRPIAVDWAIPKNQYASQTSTEDTSKKDTTNGKPPSTSEDKIEGDSNIDEVQAQGASSEEEEETEEGENGEDEEIEEDEEEDAESEGDEEEDDEEFGGDKDKQKNKSWKGDSSETERKSDVDEGKTVFLRNLDFSTSQESLKNFMSQFGDIHYALLCMDKVMERPKGTGFVKFKNPEDAQKCVDASGKYNLQLDGRHLDAFIAVTREDLDKQKQEQQKEPKDKRNLFLAREGFIRPGTKAASGVSTTDMAKRQQNELWKRQMLRNLHMYISRERLCVHNLPPKMSDKQLKKLFLKHSNKGAKVVECKIMRDLKSLVEGNVHPSKGYGFVTFAKHEDALQSLRNINNNPAIFSAEKRPIVEFSVENRAAVKAKLLRAQKSQENFRKVKMDLPKKNRTVYAQNDSEVADYSGAKADPKIKNLPTHSGPKIRHQKRPQPQEETSSRKPKISRKMFKNPSKRKNMKKNSNHGEPPMKKKKVDTATNKKTAKGKNSSDAPFQQKRKWFD